MAEVCGFVSETCDIGSAEKTTNPVRKQGRPVAKGGAKKRSAASNKSEEPSISKKRHKKVQ